MFLILAVFFLSRYLLIMPTLLQLYSNHQTNKLVRTTVEYTVKQFYLMNRKPFILQMFGSVSAILDTDEDSQYGDAHKVITDLISGFSFKLMHYVPMPCCLPLECRVSLLVILQYVIVLVTKAHTHPPFSQNHLHWNCVLLMHIWHRVRSCEEVIQTSQTIPDSLIYIVIGDESQVSFHTSCVCVLTDWVPELYCLTLYLGSNITHHFYCSICNGCTTGTGISPPIYKGLS
jgi:hypothetical protein